MSVTTGSPDSLKAEVEQWGLGQRHGMVALDAEGKLVLKKDGHMFGRTPEMARQAIDEAAAALLKK